MTSFLFKLDPKDEAAASLFDQVYHQLHKAADQARQRGTTLTELADKVGLDKSRVSRMLNGEANLTLRSLAVLAHALDHHWNMSLVDNNSGAENGLAGGVSFETSTDSDDIMSDTESTFDNILPIKKVTPSELPQLTRLSRVFRSPERVTE